MGGQKFPSSLCPAQLKRRNLPPIHQTNVSEHFDGILALGSVEELQAVGAGVVGGVGQGHGQAQAVFELETRAAGGRTAPLLVEGVESVGAVAWAREPRARLVAEHQRLRPRAQLVPPPPAHAVPRRCTAHRTVLSYPLLGQTVLHRARGGDGEGVSRRVVAGVGEHHVPPHTHDATLARLRARTQTPQLALRITIWVQGMMVSTQKPGCHPQAGLSRG